MIVLKEKRPMLVISMLLLLLISLIVNTSTSAAKNSESTTVQSSAGITFTDKEKTFQDKPEGNDTTSDNQDLGGDGNISSGDNQNGKSIFPQTGEKSTITPIVNGLLMVLLVSSYFCHKKYNNFGKKVKI